jgi:hypothetical protein
VWPAPDSLLTPLAEQFYANMRIGGAPVAAAPADKGVQDAPAPERMDLDEPAMGIEFLGQDDMPHMDDMRESLGAVALPPAHPYLQPTSSALAMRQPPTSLAA